MATETEVEKEYRRSDRPQTITALLIGSILTIIGILGALLAGQQGDLFIFGRNYLHDAIHLITGLIGLGAGYRGGRMAENYNKSMGILYLLLFILGIIFTGLLAGIINLDPADNYLHLLLGLILAGVGFGLSRRRRS